MGERIRELRRAAQITQRSLSEDLGVSPSAVGMYEQGRRVPDIETISVLCSKFGVTADYLLFGYPKQMDASELAERLCSNIEGMLGRVYHGDIGMTHAELYGICDKIREAFDAAVKLKRR